MNRPALSSSPRRADQLVRYAPWLAVSFGLAFAAIVISVHPPAPGASSPPELPGTGEQPSAERVAPPPPLPSADVSLSASNGTATVRAANPSVPLNLQPTVPIRDSNTRGAARPAGVPGVRPGASNQVASAAAVAGKSAGAGVSTPAHDAPNAVKPVSPAPAGAASVPARSQPFRGMIQKAGGTTLTGMVQWGPDDLTIRTARGTLETVSFAQWQAVRPLSPESTLELPEHGVLATYFTNRELKGSGTQRAERVIDFDWKNGAPLPNFPTENFSGRWEGELAAPVSGRFTMHTESNDGVRLWVDGRLLIDQWNNHSNRVHEATIELQAGRRYPLKMEHYEQGGTAVARLFWTPPGQERQIVPLENLFPAAPAAAPVPPTPAASTNGPGVLLTGGSYLAGEIKSANETSVLLSGRVPVTEVALVNVAVLRLRRYERPNAPLPAGRVGLLLQTGEFVEGEFRGMVNSKVVLNSILHGRRTFERNEVAAIALHDAHPAGQFEVVTRHDTRLRADTIAVAPPALVVRDTTLAQVSIPLTNVIEIRKAGK